ncbi:MAG TPA: DUF4388 domain-containing protein [Gemmatimonadales bacterium]|nr:DUF4388 domain-containing protein [Gemmatimonadales bacterium]
MAIKGSLKEASLPDVIQLLFLGRRTGCLAVADRQSFGAIYFDDGRITYASIVNRRDRLGDMLVRSGRITAEQLDEAIARQEADRDQRLGEILVAAGAITRQELEDYMRLQIEEAVYFLFTWTTGTFNFEAGVRPEQQDFLVAINPEALLLEGARRVDEWSLIAKKIPSFDLIFAVDPERLDGSDAALSASQRQLLPLLDGKRDVQQLMDESGLAEFEVGKGLFGLITAGFVRRVGTSAGATSPRVNETRVDEHRNLGIAFYKTGMLDEALREFRRVAELRPSEGGPPFYLGLIALKQARWDEAVQAFRASLEKGGPRPAPLHNLAFALEQLGQLDEAEAAEADAVARNREDPALQLGWGIIALKRGDVEAARARLTRARELWGNERPPAIWFWAAALAAALAEGSVEALELGRAGVEAYPLNPVLRNNLGVLLEVAGDTAAAEAMVRGAFTEEPTLAQASKNLADLLYRNGRYDEAYQAYERAAKLAPELGDDLYFKMGNIAYKRRDHGTARASWQRAASLNPGHQLARANLEMLDQSS